MNACIRTIVFLIALSSLSCGSSDVVSGPKLVVSPSTIDLGVIGSYARAAYEVTLTNLGDSPVSIRNAAGSCKCLVTSTPTQLILPGTSATLSIEFDPTDVIGPYEEEITIEWCDDPARNIIIRVAADVQDTLHLSRRYFGLQATPVWHEDTNSIEISPLDLEAAFEVTEVLTPEYIVCTVEKGTDRNGNVSTLYFALTPEAAKLPIGVHRTRLVATTTDSRQSTIHIDAAVSVEPSIRVEPSTVYLSDVAPDRAYDFTVTVREAAGQLLRIASIESDFTGLEYAIEDSLDGEMKFVEFLLPSSELAQGRSGNIRLHGTETDGDLATIHLRVD